MWGTWGGRAGIEVRSFTLKNASPSDVAAALNRALPKAIKAAVPEPQTNRLLVVADVAAMKDVNKLIEEAEARPGKGPGPVGPMGPGPMGVGPRPVGPMGGLPMGMGTGAAKGAELKVFVLKHAAADDMVPLLKKVFATAEITADPRTNQLIIRADQATVAELAKLLEQLDVEASKRK